MAEGEVEILVRAVDNATATLKKIEGQVETTAKNSEKANQSLGQSFMRVQGAMLNLGQVAQGIHNIFETNERVTRTLENAYDRLENANLRLQHSAINLTNAQRKLNDMQTAGARDSITLERAQLRLEDTQRRYKNMLASGLTPENRYLKEALLDVKEAELDLQDAQGLGAKRAQELADAQRDLTNAQDAVTIANNNVERAQRGLNKAIGDSKWAYVDMGMEALRVVGNIYALKLAAGSLTGVLGTGGLTTAASTASSAIGIGAAGLAGALAAIVAIPLAAHISELSAQASAYDTLGSSAEGARIRVRDLDEQMKKTTGMGGTRITEPERMEVGPYNFQTGQFEIPEAKQTKNTFWSGGLIGMLQGMNDKAKQTTEEVFPKLNEQALMTAKYVEGVGFMIGSENKGSFPIVYSLKLAEQEWMTMATISKQQIQMIIDDLNRIPKEITTIHRIITVYSGGGGGSALTSSSSKTGAKK